MRKFECVLCGEECEGIGNNPIPVNEGECCDECNKTMVVPERLRILGERMSLKEI